MLPPTNAVLQLMSKQICKTKLLKDSNKPRMIKAIYFSLLHSLILPDGQPVFLLQALLFFNHNQRYKISSIFSYLWHCPYSFPNSSWDSLHLNNFELANYTISTTSIKVKHIRNLEKWCRRIRRAMRWHSSQ